METPENYLSLLDDVVKNIPGILFIATLLLSLFFENKLYIIIYLIGFLINYIINRVSRNIIQDTRLIENGTEKYNNPSGHAQMSFFSFAFVTFLLLKTSGFPLHYNVSIIVFYLALCLITTGTCIAHEYHTTDQIVLGTIIGSVNGLIVGYYALRFAK